MSSCCPANRENQSDSTSFNYRYNKLKNLTEYHCEPSCICKAGNERSTWDVIQTEWMKGKKPDIKPASKNFQKSWKTS